MANSFSIYYLFLPCVFFQAFYFKSLSSIVVLYVFIALKVIDSTRRNIHEESISNPNSKKSINTTCWYFYMFIFTFAAFGYSVRQTFLEYQNNPEACFSAKMLNNYHTVTVCFVYWWRSAFMIDVIERKVLHDTFLHSIFLGRTIAAIGEVVFMRQ
jgi:hypothetical protein